MKDYVAFAIALFIVVIYVLAEIAKASCPRGSATAKCRDGSLSYSPNACGTCSHHCGVAVWL
jgi:hypothetical protein